MKFFYLGVDITESIDIKKANVTDVAGGQLDSINIVLNNTDNDWSNWNLKKNDLVELKESGYTSGKMYIDEIIQEASTISIKALPIRQEAKEENTRSWNDINFMELVQEFARKYNLKVKTYGVNNHFYKRINQLEMADFSFLNCRCELEGYLLKITDNSLVIYNERFIENQVPAITLSKYEFIDGFLFKDRSSDIYGGCSIIYNDISYKFKDSNTYGPILKIKNIPVYNPAEAQRYTKNLLRLKNKFEKTMKVEIKKNTGIAAGIVVNVIGCGIADGNYFIHKVMQNLGNDTTVLILRQILKGF